LLLIQEEEVRRYDGVRGWRKGGWVTCERRLLKVLDRRTLISPADIAAFIPPTWLSRFLPPVSPLPSANREVWRKNGLLPEVMDASRPGQTWHSILYARTN
jgi:hypothetical protein